MSSYNQGYGDADIMARHRLADADRAASRREAQMEARHKSELAAAEEDKRIKRLASDCALAALKECILTLPEELQNEVNAAVAAHYEAAYTEIAKRAGLPLFEQGVDSNKIIQTWKSRSLLRRRL